MWGSNKSVWGSEAVGSFLSPGCSAPPLPRPPASLFLHPLPSVLPSGTQLFSFYVAKNLPLEPVHFLHNLRHLNMFCWKGGQLQIFHFRGQNAAQRLWVPTFTSLPSLHDTEKCSLPWKRIKPDLCGSNFMCTLFYSNSFKLAVCSWCIWYYNVFNMHISLYNFQSTPTCVTSFDHCIITDRQDKTSVWYPFSRFKTWSLDDWYDLHKAKELSFDSKPRTFATILQLHVNSLLTKMSN